MKQSEFISTTGLSAKTSRWLYDNVFSLDGRSRLSHRIYKNCDVDWVLEHSIELFTDITGIRIHKIDENKEYYVSEDGRVWNNSRGFLEQMVLEENAGYNRVRLVIDGKGRHYRVGRLVATYFLENKDNKPIVNHIDGNKQNDDVNNLEWATYSENTQHAYDCGLARNASGAEDSQSKSVTMFDNNGNIISNFGSIREAVRETGLSLGYIGNHVRREVKHGTQGVYFNYSSI